MISTTLLIQALELGKTSFRQVITCQFASLQNNY